MGLENYKGMFQMQFYWDSWKNTFIFLALQLAMCFFIPLIQALLLNELVKLQKCFTTLYILPALIPTSVNVIIWKWIWHPDYGVANQIVKFFGGQPQAWLKMCIRDSVYPAWDHRRQHDPGIAGGKRGRGKSR